MMRWAVGFMQLVPTPHQWAVHSDDKMHLMSLAVK